MKHSRLWSDSSVWSYGCTGRWLTAIARLPWNSRLFLPLSHFSRPAGARRPSADTGKRRFSHRPCCWGSLVWDVCSCCCFCPPATGPHTRLLLLLPQRSDWKWETEEEEKEKRERGREWQERLDPALIIYFCLPGFIISAAWGGFVVVFKHPTHSEFQSHCKWIIQVEQMFTDGLEIIQVVRCIRMFQGERWSHIYICKAVMSFAVKLEGIEPKCEKNGCNWVHAMRKYPDW